ncbi:cytochrome B [Crenobacter sp. SG2305]|uniref:cytochrome b/b6 domain-containing protein n=1 Tax=Crenobacter oryzisoli TaxID=3056844 RepID=UPI0025AAF121|nr:cytochrome b/b6 domain-containing protein [Crenobacter sp. SG2305]MDN0082565.1 cytochrome B [Crenobacter sp. SG2305]
MSPFNRFRSWHWLFAGLLLTAYLTGSDGGLLHVWLGYVLIPLFVIRFVIGLFHLRGFPRLLPTLQQWREASSSLLGKLISIGLLLCCLLTCVSGLAMVDNGKILGLSNAQTTPIVQQMNWGEENAENWGAMGIFSADEAGDFHAGAANATLLLAGLHVLWVFIYRRTMILNMTFGSLGQHKRTRSLADERKAN